MSRIRHWVGVAVFLFLIIALSPVVVLLSIFGEDTTKGMIVVCSLLAVTTVEKLLMPGGLSYADTLILLLYIFSLGCLVIHHRDIKVFIAKS